MPLPARSLSARVLVRLISAEVREIDPWLRDDLRIARLTVAYAAHEDAVLCSPDVLASYIVLGLHPEKVWPAIQARRMALGPLEVSVAPPKKPAQAVKLWSEKTIGARAANSRAGSEMVLRGPRLLPMATASIAALYPNSDAPSSTKTRGFTYAETLDIVRHSYVRAAVRRATLNALTARGPWPGADGPASRTICVAFDGMALGDEKGDGICHRRTAQRRAKLACDLKYWRLVHKFNRWLNCPKCGAERTQATCPNSNCKHRGRSRNRDGSTNTKEFCRPYTFEIDLEKFLTAEPSKYIRHFCARTWKEHKEAAKRGEHPNLKEMPRKTPAPVQPPRDPAPAVPLPQRQRPAAMAKPEHRDSARPLTTRQRKELVLRIPIYIQGDGNGRQDRNTGEWIGPGDPDYRGPLNKQAATLMACNSMCQTDGVSFRRALEAAAEAGFRVESLERSGAVARAAGYTIEGLENASPPEGEKEQT